MKNFLFPVANVEEDFYKTEYHYTNKAAKEKIQAKMSK